VEFPLFTKCKLHDVIVIVFLFHNHNQNGNYKFSVWKLHDIIVKSKWKLQILGL